MGFRFSTFAFEVLNFLIFVWLLRKMLYAPLQKAITARRDAHARAEQQISALTERAEQLRTEQEAEQRRRRAEADEEIARARASAERERATVLGRADEEIQDRERRQVERLAMLQRDAERVAARDALDAARRATVELLRSLELGDLDGPLTEQLLSAVESARADPSGAHSPLETMVELRSAHPLAPERWQALRERLRRALGPGVSPELEDDPSLLAGAVLRVGDDVYDASLSERVERAYQAAERRLEAGPEAREA